MLYDLNNYIAEAKQRGTSVRFPRTDKDTYEELFEDLIEWDQRNLHNNLIVYEYDHMPVAFYDVTTLEGFILMENRK
jgi:hypothetical protein